MKVTNNHVYSFIIKMIFFGLFVIFALPSISNNLEFINPTLVKQIDSLNQLSYKNRRTNPKLALEYAIKANELCKGNDYVKGFAASLHNRGTARAVLGNYDLGMLDLLEASRLREQIEDHEGLVSTFNNIGFVFSEMGNDRKALEYYQKSLDYQNKTNLKRDLGIVYNNIGSVYLRENKLDQALTYYYKALDANKEDGDERGIGASKSNIGTIYSNLGQYKKGLEFHFQAYELIKKNKDNLGMMSTMRYISNDYLHLGEIEKATDYALKSLQLAQQIGSMGEEKNSAILLATIYEKQGRTAKALELHKLVNTLKDSLFSVEKAEALGRMQALLEIETKAKENEILRREQEASHQQIRMQKLLLLISVFSILIAIAFILLIIKSKRKVKKANIELKAINKEVESQKIDIQQKANALDEKNSELREINQIKDKLISVIAHDLKNPFNSISGYSEIIISQFDGYSKSELLSFLRIINDNSARGNMLLDNLLQWSRLQTKTIQYLPVKQNLYKLVFEELFFVQHIANEKNIHISNSIEKEIIVFADSNMLRTVIRNLVSNSIKFTPNDGKVIISAFTTNEGTTLVVEDSGKGIEKNIKEKLFTGEAGVTTTGYGGEKGTGLGLMLCKDFIDKHNGKIWVESEPNTGAKFFIQLPSN